MHCLIVDDNEADIQAIEDALEGIADRVDTCDAYNEALDQIRAYQERNTFPQLVFVDFSIETRNDGADLIRHLQDLHAFSAIIIMTGLLTDDVSEAAAQLNVDVILKDSVAENTIVTEICLKAVTRWNALRQEQTILFAKRRQQFLLTLSKVSHDLQNMLFGINNIAYALRVELENYEINPEVLADNQQEMESNIQLADHVLALLTSYGKMTERKLNTQIVNPNDAIKSIVNSCKKESGILIELSSPCVPAVHLDCKSIDHVFRILTQNVSMHCPAGTKVQIVMKLIDAGQISYLQLLYMDNGPGIEECERIKIFEPVYQIKTTKASSEPVGSGIGLNSADDEISSYVVDGYLASIKCVSRPDELDGACFDIRIPCHVVREA